MKDLRILSEITTRYGNRNVNELEFKTPEEFATYKKKHKMRPGTVVKVAGKDKVVGKDDASKTSTKKRFEDITFSTASIDQIKKFAEDKASSVISNPPMVPSFAVTFPLMITLPSLSR